MHDVDDGAAPASAIGPMNRLVMFQVPLRLRSMTARQPLSVMVLGRVGNCRRRRRRGGRRVRSAAGGVAEASTCAGLGYSWGRRGSPPSCPRRPTLMQGGQTCGRRSRVPAEPANAWATSRRTRGPLGWVTAHGVGEESGCEDGDRRSGLPRDHVAVTWRSPSSCPSRNGEHVLGDEDVVTSSGPSASRSVRAPGTSGPAGGPVHAGSALDLNRLVDGPAVVRCHGDLDGPDFRAGRGSDVPPSRRRGSS